MRGDPHVPDCLLHRHPLLLTINVVIPDDAQVARRPEILIGTQPQLQILIQFIHFSDLLLPYLSPHLPPVHQLGSIAQLPQLLEWHSKPGLQLASFLLWQVDQPAFLVVVVHNLVHEGSVVEASQLQQGVVDENIRRVTVELAGCCRWGLQECTRGDSSVELVPEGSQVHDREQPPSDSTVSELLGCVRSRHALQGLPGLGIEVHIVEIHKPQVFPLIGHCFPPVVYGIDQPEHLTADQLVVSVDIDHNFSTFAVVPDHRILVPEGILPLLISNQHGLLFQQGQALQ